MSAKPRMNDTRSASQGLACQQDSDIVGLPDVTIDEMLVMKMEAREDAERGQDEFNEETFGADAAMGWSYEQQVAANAKLGVNGISPRSKQARSDASTDVSESDIEVQ